MRRNQVIYNRKLSHNIKIGPGIISLKEVGYISKSQIKELNEDYQSGYSLRQLSEKYHITHIHRYLYPDTKLRRK